MAGAHIRLWQYWRDQDKWVPFWGSNHGGDWSHYKDVGDDIAGQEVEYWFAQMKKLPPTLHAGQSSHSYGASSTVPLGHQTSPLGQLPGPSCQGPHSFRTKLWSLPVKLSGLPVRISSSHSGLSHIPFTPCRSARRSR